MKKLLLIAALFPFVCSAQIYKNWATSNAVPHVPSFALTATLGTNTALYASNQFGVFAVPYWSVASFSDRAQFIDQSNFVIMEIRHSGVAPDGVNEGTFNNVIYFGGQEDFDAFSFNFPDIGDNGRLTFIFNDEAYQWRWRNNRLVIDPTSTGVDQYTILQHDNGAGNISFGDTNQATHLLGKHVEIPSTSYITNAAGPGIYMGTTSGPTFGAANGSLFLSSISNGVLYFRTNGNWVIK